MTKRRQDRRPRSRTPHRPASPRAAAAPWANGDVALGQPAASAILAVIGLAAVFLRLAELFQPMDYDEAFTYVYFASRPLGQALADYSLPNNHLLHTLLVHVLTGPLGNHPWVVRLPAFLAGLALVPATYLLARRFFGSWAGLLAAALVACAPPLVDYSANARGYTMVCLAFVWSLTLAARLLAEDRRRDWIVFAAVSAAGLYTIPTMIYAFGGVALWLLLSIRLDVEPPRRGAFLRRTLFSVFAIGAAALAAYAPIWARSGWSALLSKGTGSPSWPVFRVTMAASLAAVWRQWNQAVPAVAAVAIAAAFLAGVIWHRRLSPYRLSPALPAFLFPAVPLLVQRVVPFTRVWLYLLPLYFATAAAAVARAAQRLPALGRTREEIRKLALLAAALLIVGGMGARGFLLSRARFADAARVDRICDDLAPRLQSGDLVAAHGYWATPIAYYLERQDIAVQRLSADWTLEVLRVVGRKDAPRTDPARPPRTFLVVRAEDGATVAAIQEKARAAGASADLTPLRSFGTTTVYEVGLSK